MKNRQIINLMNNCSTLLRIFVLFVLPIYTAVNAQCYTELDFDNQDDIPSECGVDWEETGVVLSFDPTTTDDCFASNSCNFGSGTLPNDPDENILNLEGARLYIDLTSFDNELQELKVYHYNYCNINIECTKAYLIENNEVVDLQVTSYDPELQYFMFDLTNFDDPSTLIISSPCAWITTVKGFYNCSDPGNADNCLGLDDLEIGDVYGDDSGYAPGDSFYEEDNIHFTPEEFQYANGNTGFKNLEIWEGNLLPTSPDKAFWMGNISTQLDFSALPDPVTEVTFEFWFGGGELNLGANGDIVNFDQIFFNLPYEISPGIFLDIEFEPVNSAKGTVIISGDNLESILIGGQELLVGNFCYATDPVFEPITDCLDFEEIDDGTNFSSNQGYQPGDTLFELEDVMFVSTQNSTNPPNEVWITSTMGPPFMSANENYVYLSGSLGVDFNGYPDKIKEIAFDYKLLPATPNSFVLLNINDTTQINLNAITSDTTIHVGNLSIDIEIFLSANSAGIEGHVKITGNCFQHLNFSTSSPNYLILIDNLCFSAYSTDCLTLDDLEINQQFGAASGLDPGDQFYEENGIKFLVEEFLLDNNTTLFENVIVEDGADFLDPGTKYLRPSNINMVLDFTNLGEEVTQVTFDWAELSSFYNIAVNGEPILVHDATILDLPTDIAPGVTLEVILDDTDPIPIIGSAILTGNIETLLIGSQESAFGNFCYEILTSPPCEIGEVIVEAHPCTPNGIFFVDLDFDYENTSDSFTVVGNGTDYGTFSYDDLYLTLGPLDGDGSTVYEFIVKDQDNPDCSNFAEIGPINCNSASCGFEDFEIYNIECEVDDDGNALYYFKLNFEPVNTDDLGFDLFIDGEFFAFYEYDDLPVWVEGVESDDLVIEVKICDNDNPDCCSDAIFWQLPSCDDDDCELDDLEVYIGDCNNAGQFEIKIDFEYENVSDSFIVFGNGMIYDTYAYDDLPVFVGPFDGDDQTVYEVIIKDQDNPDCQISEEFGPVDCDNGVCGFEDFEIYNIECEVDDDGNALYYFKLNFEPVNTDDLGFDLFIDGEFFAFYEYDDLPVWGEGVESDDLVIEVKICDNDNPNCCSDVINWQLPICDDDDECAISDFEAETFCDGDVPYVTFSFESENTSDSFVVISCNTITTLPFGQNSYTIELTGLDLSCAVGGFIPFGIYDQQQMTDCFDLTFIEVPDCDSDVCSISNLEVTPLDCIDGEFEVELDFDFENTSGNFAVIGNGTFYGIFSYDDLPVTVGTFEGDDQTIYELGVYDVANTDCAAWTEFGPVACEECLLSELEYDITCENDTAFIEFSFEYEGTSDSFLVISCFPLGTFAYGQGSYTVPVSPELIDCVGDLIIPFTIYDQTNNNSCFLAEFIEVPDCSACSIHDLVVEPYDCEDGEFYADLDFEHYNTGNFGFLVFVNDEVFGPFEYDELPIPLGPFPADGTDYDFLVLDLEDPFCFGYFELGEVECDDDLCGLDDLEVIGECINQGVFNLWIDIEVDNAPNSLFDLYLNDEYYGFYAFSDLPITIDEYVTNEEELIIVACVNDYPDCCLEVEIDLDGCLIVNCFEFDDLDLATTYDNVNSQPGDLLFDDNDVTVKIADPLIGQWNSLTYDYYSPFQNDDSPGFLISGGLTFDFSELPNPPTSFTFDGLGPVWIKVDDHPLLDLLPISPVQDTVIEISADLLLEISAYATGNDEYQYELIGEASSITVGSQDGYLVDFCFEIDYDVWPGDGNFDNIANHYDLLSIGIGYGTEGPQRDVVDTDWEPLPALNWGQSFANGTNYKHADCNGDGLIWKDDILAIEQNYNATHGPVPTYDTQFGGPNDPPLFMDIPDPGEVELGESFSIPIYLGTNSNPVDEIYGIAFSVEVSSNFVSEGQINIEPGFLGDLDDLIYLTQKTDQGFDVAISRIDQANIQGSGMIAYFSGIIDDLAGLQQDDIIIHSIRAINNEEEEVPIYATTGILSYETNDQKSLDVFPNPTDGYMTIINDSPEPVKEIMIFNSLGEMMIRIDQPDDILRVDATNWGAGMYWIKARYSSEIISKKIKVTTP